MSTSRLAPKQLKGIRLRLKMNLVGASYALGISPSKLERIEHKGGIDHSATELKDKYVEFIRSAPAYRLSNTLLGEFPVSFARHALDLTVEEIARRFAVSKSQWSKYESNSRTLGDDLKVIVEREVLTALEEIISKNKAPD